MRNRGDALGLHKYRHFLAEYWKPVYGRDLPDAWPTFIASLLKSAFGVFGNLNILMPGVFYVAAALLIGTGCCAGAIALRRATGVSCRAGLWLAAGIVLNLSMVFYNCWYIDFQAQGRYVLLNALLVTGLGAYSVDSFLSDRGRRAWRGILVVFFASSAIVAVGRVYQRPCRPPPVAMRASSSGSDRFVHN